MEQKLEMILESLKELKEGQLRLESKIDKLDEKIELLTNQTSNAVIEHHDKSIEFLKSKVIELEQDIFTLKQS